MGNETRLNTLYQQAVFQATQHYIEEVPLNTWLLLVIKDQRCWHCAKDYTAYVQAGLSLHAAIFAAISCHPRNAEDLPILHVVHPITLPAHYMTGDAENATDLHFDVVVDWFEEVGLRSRLAMDFADALLEDIDTAIRFYNDLPDPITDVVRGGRDDH